MTPAPLDLCVDGDYPAIARRRPCRSLPATPGPAAGSRSRPALSRLTAAVAARRGAGELTTDRQPIVEDEHGDHGHAEDGEHGARQGSGGDPDQGEPEAPADSARPAESMLVPSSR
jgi:hypothetical protein